jgi:soluble lytic murein transglycosylase-like protein
MFRFMSALAAAALVFAAGGVARAQVVELGQDGSVTSHDGPEVVTREGARPILPAGAGQRVARIAAAGSAVHQAIRSAAQRHGLSEALVDAVAWRESAFDATAVSPRGAVGVMQLMPGTARGLAVDAHDLGANVEGGTAYLAQLLHHFDGDVVKALAAYNAGPAAVDRFGGAPPYPETTSYLDSVLDRLSREALAQPAAPAPRAP